MSTRRWLYRAVLAYILLNILTSLSLAQRANAEAPDASAPATGLLQWQKDGVALVTAVGNQRAPQIVTDGAGGAIVVWQDFRPYWSSEAPRCLYAQRVSETGHVLWLQDGIRIALLGNIDPQLVSDGQGGAIVAWYDERSNVPNVYVQRLRPDGAFVWTPQGVALATGRQEGSPRLASDGNGGAFVAWSETDDAGRRAVRAQHVLADGTPTWGAGGVTVLAGAQEQVAPQVAADSAGGAIVAWRGNCTPGWQGLCVQRLARNGARAWGDGVIISVAPSPYAEIQLLVDDAGDATIVWVDRRNLHDDIYAQRVSDDGTLRWASGGVPVIVAPGDQVLPRLVTGGHEGSIVAWHDTRLAENGIYAQHLDGDGKPTWNPTGVPINSGSVPFMSAHPGTASPVNTWLEPYYDIASDGNEGMLVTWWGAMKAGAGIESGVWMQRVKAEGVQAWPATGVLVQPDRHGVGAPHLLNDRVGGAIVVWEDNRRWYKTDEYDIYAQRVVEGSYHSYLPLTVR